VTDPTGTYRYCSFTSGPTLLLRHLGRMLTGMHLLVVGLIGLLAAGCSEPLVRNDLDAIKARGELVFITRNNATCYYEGPYGPTGFEYELVKAFADHLGVKVRPLVIEEEAEMVAALRRGAADLIAAGFPFGKQAARLVTLGPGYYKITQLVVGRRGGPEIRKIQDLGDDPIWITGSSNRLELLKQLQIDHPRLNWQTLNEYSSEELLQMVWNRALPLAMVDSTMVAMNRRYFPELMTRLEMGQPQDLAWAIHPQSRHLLAAVRSWFAQQSTQDKIKGLTEHYYSHLEDFDYVDLIRFRERIGKRLPQYRTYFEEAAAKYSLDWQLVAAQAYQESHWDPGAISFTGVRGIMQLTQDTAKTLGVQDRMAVKETIFAGTRYLARLHRMLDDEIPEPDRTFMALAAYNIGFGHLRDARKLAMRLNKPANTWYGVRAVLPLLRQKKYYQTVERGYARGDEAVQYVDRIRTYHRILNNVLAPPPVIEFGG
jgi:membrane-bound lytic murein transglycosylase F